MKPFNLIIFFLLFSIAVKAQNSIIEIENIYVNPNGQYSDLVGYSPILKLESDTIYNKNESLKIVKLPSKLNTLKLAYTFLYFNGLPKNNFENELVLLIENYDSHTPIIYIDRNGNLDFSDDGAPVKFKDALTLELTNTLDPSAIYHYKLIKSTIKPEFHERIKSRYSSLYPKSNILSPSYWLATQRNSVKVSKGNINNKPITIFLFDNDVDGMFTFSTKEFGDRIFIKEGIYEKGEDITKYNRQGEPIDHNAVFKLYNTNYIVLNLHKNGSLLTIDETSKETRTLYKEGINISSFKIDLLSNSTITIKSLLRNNKHLLIDVGGTWCGGCIAQEPNIKKLYNDDKIEVIGVFGHDTVNSVSSYIKSHNIKWPVALMSKKFKEMFRITAYPTYILVSPEGKILFMELDSQKLMDYLSK